MENQTKCWWSLQAIAYIPIDQYTYGPGYYTETSFSTCFASETWAFELLYRKMIRDFYMEGKDEYHGYYPEEMKYITHEQAEREFLRGFEDYKGKPFIKSYEPREEGTFENRFKIEGNRLTIQLTGSISITIECLEPEGKKNEARAQKILEKFIEKFTS